MMHVGVSTVMRKMSAALWELYYDYNIVSLKYNNR